MVCSLVLAVVLLRSKMGALYQPLYDHIFGTSFCNDRFADGRDQKKGIKIYLWYNLQYPGNRKSVQLRERNKLSAHAGALFP